MKTYKTLVIVWKDIVGNYYGRLVFIPSFVPKELTVFCSSSKPRLMNDIKKTLQITFETYCRDWDYDEASNEYKEENEYTLSMLTVETKSVHLDSDMIPISFHKLPFTTPMIRTVYSSDIVKVYLPFEDISFFCSKSDSAKNQATLLIQSCLLNVSVNTIIFYPQFIDTELCPVAVSVNNKKKRQRESKKNNFPTLNRVAVPFRNFMRKRQNSLPFECQDQTEQLLKTIRNLNSGLIICGKRGCGKTSLLYSVIHLYEKELLKKGNNSKSNTNPLNYFWLSTADKLQTGTQYLGEWQEQLLDMISELCSFKGYLCIENLAALINNQYAPENSLAGFLLPYIEQGKIKFIAEATPEELISISTLYPAFVEKCQTFRIEEMDEEKAVIVLKKTGEKFVNINKNMEIEESAVTTAIALCKRFYSALSLPGSVLPFWKRSLERQAKTEQQYLDHNNILESFVEENNMPLWLFQDENAITFDSIFQKLSEQVIGQPMACQAVTRAILKFKAAMNNPKRPIASFLFCGPTGVGKTQLIKTLTEFLFNQKKTETRDQLSKNANEHLIRLDMSEYQFPFQATRLIETSDGKPSSLIQHVQKNPFSIILFDEIEKASSTVFDTLLSLLDEGRLTDRMGRTTLFRNCIIVMTSNLGAELKRASGFFESTPSTLSPSGSDEISLSRAQKSLNERYQKVVEDFFRPEFINRIDEIVYFNHLNRDSCEKIVQLELRNLEQRDGFRERNLRLKFGPELIDYLVRLGIDVRYGARPLQRTIESEIVVGLSHLLGKNTHLTNKTISLNYLGNNITTQIE